MSKRSYGDHAGHHDKPPGGSANREPFPRWSAGATASIVLGSLLVALAAAAIYGAHVDFERSVAFATDFLGATLLSLAGR